MASNLFYLTIHIHMWVPRVTTYAYDMLTRFIKRIPHAYTTPSSPDSARCWVPCVDNLYEKCTWEMEFVVPRYLEERQSNIMDDGEQEDIPDASPTIVVCSGDLLEQVRFKVPRINTHTINLITGDAPSSLKQNHLSFCSNCPYFCTANRICSRTFPCSSPSYGHQLPRRPYRLLSTADARILSPRPRINAPHIHFFPPLCNELLHHRIWLIPVRIV